MDYFIPMYQLWICFDKKWVGLHFGRLVHKLIWSPWVECRMIFKNIGRLSENFFSVWPICTYWAIFVTFSKTFLFTLVLLFNRWLLKRECGLDVTSACQGNCN
jgi:hypothetical protein